MDWHEISECAIENATFRPGSQISKIELSSAVHLPTRSNTAPAAAGGDGRGGHTPAPLVRRRAREVGRQRCRRPRVVPIHCTVERAPLGHGRRAPRMAGGGSTGGPHSAWPGYMCCRACTAESTALRSTVHLKRIPEGPCAKARRRHGAHRRHGALGARRPSSAALRVNDPRTVSKVVCPRPPRTSRCCSAVPVAVELNHVRLPLARAAAAWKDVGGPMSKYGPQNSWLFCSLNNILDGVTACADLVLQTT
jgi:hypothetical protein